MYIHQVTHNIVSLYYQTHTSYMYLLCTVTLNATLPLLNTYPISGIILITLHIYSPRSEYNNSDTCNSEVTVYTPSAPKIILLVIVLFSGK